MVSVNEENDNPLQKTLDQEGESGSLKTDPSTGHTRFVPTPAVLEQIETYLATTLEQTIEDYKPRHERWKRAKDAYKGIPKQGDQMITLPIVKRVVNQQWAWLSNQTLSKDPVISVKPRTDKKFTVPKYDENGEVMMQQPPVDPMTGMPMSMEMMQPQPVLEQMTSEEAAQDIEDRIAYDSQHQTHWEDLIDDKILPNILKYGLAVIKQCYETPEQKLAQKTLTYSKEKGQFVWGAEPKAVKNGAVIIPRVVSPFNFFVPVHEDDEQDSSALFEKHTPTNQDILVKVQNGVYDFCGREMDEAALDAIYGSNSTDTETCDRDRNSATTRQDIYETYFKYPVNISGQIQIVEFCADFHLKAKRLLRCYVNDLPQQMRPYDVAFMRPDEGELDGDSTALDVLPIQNLQSQLFHLQVQNMVMSNVKVFLYRKGGSTEKWFNDHPTIKPGDRIPYDEDKDISPQPLGSPIAGVSAEIAFLGDEGEKLSTVRDFDLGDIPNRTAASTVNLTQTQAKMQPTQILRRIRRPLNRALTRHVQMLAHYAPEAKQIATTDERGTVSTRLARFPLEAITEADFDIHLTATAEDESNQAEFERDVMLGKDIQAQNQQALQLLGMITPQTPPPHMQFLMTMLARSEDNLGQKMAKVRKDWKDHVLTPDKVAAMLQWFTQQAQMMAQQQAAQPQQGSPQGAPPQGGPMPPQGMGGNGGIPPTQ